MIKNVFVNWFWRDSEARIINRIDRMEKKLMAEIDDLNSSVDSLVTAVGDAGAELRELKAELDAALSRPGGVDPAAVEAAATRVGALADSLEAVTNEVKPTPPPAPGEQPTE